MNILHCRYYIVTSLIIGLSACATIDESSTISSGNWQEVGAIQNGNIKVWIDTNSIQRNGNLVQFKDKKVVNKLDRNQYNNLPNYKTAIGDWEINCVNHTYRLTSLQLLNQQGDVVFSEQYTAVDLRPMFIAKGSITERQFNKVCQ